MATPKGMRAKSIGHYILGKTIGEGTFGKVKLGTHILTGEKVAVKILEKERIVDVADVARVAREIHILKLVHHPHIIQLYEIIETPRQLYLIMEFCPGGELFDHIVANGRVREREACKFFHQIIAGVEQIHRMNVVHRDLKPENLLLDDSKNIKIVDFGLSNTFQDGQLLKTACGSPCYAAPEMVAGQRYVPSRCDVWSCGVILFALVCGYLPFEDQNTAALYRKILNADYQAPKFITDSVRDLIARMLNTDPEQRFTIPKIRIHAWYRQCPEASQSFSANDYGERVLEEDVLEQLDRFGFPREYAVKCLQMSKHNHVTTTYHLLAEKKKRNGGILKMPDHDPHMAFEAGMTTGVGMVPMDPESMPQEIELRGERTPSPYQVLDPSQKPKINVDLPQHGRAMAADADRAAGGSSPTAQPAPPKTPDNRAVATHYGNWAAAAFPPNSFGGTPGNDMQPQTARGDSRSYDYRGNAGSRQGAVSAEPPHSSGAHTARGPGARRSYDSTPRGPPAGSGAAAVAAAAAGAAGGPQSYRNNRRSPPISSSPSPVPPQGVATPRGPPGRSVTPGKRPPSISEPMTARDQPIRPGTSQGMSTPSRPPGPAGSRSSHANEARRRHYGAATPEVGAMQPVPPPYGRPGSQGSRERASSHGVNAHRPAEGAAATAAAVAADLYGHGAMGMEPTSAWASSAGGVYGSGARASSATPDGAHDGNMGAGGAAAAPLSARDARDEAMRTCRGAFNVSCTSSKSPKQIMQEITRSLTMQRVAFKQATGFLVRCQKQSLRFEMEISHLDHLESIYVVRFRRAAGELASYKELCSRILAEMKI
eukprot:TRINITY_DN7978_c0_g5_i1.p1 TRINITY_DN7978_c0_g5~~TRINITY_DN7978_c0_g5_i1.p1  ORF type:complete len:825 (+),score=159.10 TRINITY_DN7978_c0_g5_i1:186-2660(+)